MGADERKFYVEEAKNEKEWHKKVYPDYVYRAPIAVGQKMKSFKVNPSKDRSRSDETKEEAPSPVPRSPGKQKPSDPSCRSSLAAPHFLPNIDIQVLDTRRRSEDLKCLLIRVALRPSWVIRLICWCTTTERQALAILSWDLDPTRFYAPRRIS